MERDYIGWHALKEDLNNLPPEIPMFQQRDIWWCCVGANVGDEVDGKNEMYNRPVLVFRKFNRQVFLGLPMSTKIKNPPHNQTVFFEGEQRSVMLSQIRLFDARRLTDRVGRLPEKQFEKVRKSLKRLLYL